MEEPEETREARNIARFNQLRRELNAWKSKHDDEIWHIEALVGIGQRAFSVRVWFLIGGLSVPTLYEIAHSPDYGNFTVYAQEATDGFYLWDKVSVTSAARLTQALDSAY